MTHVDTVCFGGGDWSFGVYHLSSSLEERQKVVCVVAGVCEEGWWAGWDSVLREERVSLTRYSFFSPFFCCGECENICTLPSTLPTTTPLSLSLLLISPH